MSIFTINEEEQGYRTIVENGTSVTSYGFKVREEACKDGSGTMATLPTEKYMVYNTLVDDGNGKLTGNSPYDVIVSNNNSGNKINLNFSLYGAGGHEANQCTFGYNWAQSIQNLYEESGDNSYTVNDWSGSDGYNESAIKANIQTYFDYIKESGKESGQATFMGHSNGGGSALKTACDYITMAQEENVSVDPVNIIYLDAQNVFSGEGTPIATHNSTTNAILAENNAHVTLVTTSIKAENLNSDLSFVENLSSSTIGKLGGASSAVFQSLAEDDGIFCTYVVPVLTEGSGALDHGGVLKAAVMGELNILEFINGNADHIGENETIEAYDSKFELHYVVYSSADEEWKEVTAEELKTIEKASEYYTYKKYYDADGNEKTELFTDTEYTMKIDIDSIMSAACSIVSACGTYEITLDDSLTSASYNGNGNSAIPNNLGGIGTAMGSLVDTYVSASVKNIEGLVDTCKGYFSLDEKLAEDGSTLNGNLDSLYSGLQNGNYTIDFGLNTITAENIDVSSLLGSFDSNSISCASDLEYMYNTGINNAFDQTMSLLTLCRSYEDAISTIESNCSGAWVDAVLDSLEAMHEDTLKITNEYNMAKVYVKLEVDKLLQYMNSTGYDSLSACEIPGLMDDISFCETSIAQMQTEMKRTKLVAQYDGVTHQTTYVEVLYYDSAQLAAMQAQIDAWTEQIEIINQHIDYINTYEEMALEAHNNIENYVQNASNKIANVINGTEVVESSGTIS